MDRDRMPHLNMKYQLYGKETKDSPKDFSTVNGTGTWSRGPKPCMLDDDDDDDDDDEKVTKPSPEKIWEH
jgi:hypothetical protein